jgi:[acyl-carrier-protein] S-malonyltransferase
MSATFDDTTLALFPGQGSITGGAGEPWRLSPTWSVVEEISLATNLDVSAMLLTLSSEELVRTDRAQLATFALSMVGWRDYVLTRPAPRYLAGHSLGELTALVAAGVLSLEDGAQVVAERGAAMAAASTERPGTMVALMGPGDDAIEKLATAPHVHVANFNGPGQVVVSGARESLAPLLADARAFGWRRATALPVGGAFHSPLMAPAQDALESALDKVEFRATDHVIGCNVDGTWRAGGPQWRELLARQLTNPVQFSAMIESLAPEVTVVVEAPPAGVLIGLTKRIRPFAALLALEEPLGA